MCSKLQCALSLPSARGERIADRPQKGADRGELAGLLRGVLKDMALPGRAFDMDMDAIAL